MCAWFSMRYFTTSSVVSQLVLCETWLQTQSRLIKCVCVLEADWERSDRLVCVCSKEWKRAKWSSAHTAFDKRLWWQARLSCVHTASRHSLLHCILHSFESNMSSGDISQSAHVPCCRCLFTLFVWAFFSHCISPLPSSTPSLPLLSLPLTWKASAQQQVFTLTHNISRWVSNERWMLDELRSLGVAAYLSVTMYTCLSLLYTFKPKSRAYTSMNWKKAETSLR